MQQRASIARALLHDPAILLMDEPFGALDAQTRLQLQDDLLRLWNLGRKTIVFVTHDISEAIALGDRTIVLTRQPSAVAGEHAITIPRPRDIRGILTHPEFVDLYQRIRAQVQ
jgi:NitT/TauT family transport system ATP-binding protein